MRLVIHMKLMDGDEVRQQLAIDSADPALVRFGQGSMSAAGLAVLNALVQAIRSERASFPSVKVKNQKTGVKSDG